MGKVAELLRRKRQAQITSMETGKIVDTSEVDEQLSRVEVVKRDSRPPPKASLKFSQHARRRMSQRGLSARDVYAIWYNGEASQSGDGMAYHMSDKAIADGPRNLHKLRGTAIIVRYAREDPTQLILVTVLADGEDTTFVRGS